MNHYSATDCYGDLINRLNAGKPGMNIWPKWHVENFPEPDIPPQPPAEPEVPEQPIPVEMPQ